MAVHVVQMMGGTGRYQAVHAGQMKGDRQYAPTGVQQAVCQGLMPRVGGVLPTLHLLHPWLCETRLQAVLRDVSKAV